MKINEKIYSLVNKISIIGILIIIGLHFLKIGNVSFYILFLFFGLQQIFDGLNKIELTQQKDSKEHNKISKKGVFDVICGLAFMIVVIIGIIRKTLW
ncbi:hypothetical protein I6U48_23950 [Clostridium sp. PL3]|uniref:Uncharacterized protein n=1 Tax=Clostridium thailandense TaxID=2794346 RepID=A0A949TYH7_9CLOT|nr:hypothetical protein [Clostridium thailandense]MBV7275951.1 hypothetical protein [Clostridium thailandense]